MRKDHNTSSLPCLGFLIGRSVWLRPEAADEGVQYCKNCLLVPSIHCLFPPNFACGQGLLERFNDSRDRFSKTKMERSDAKLVIEVRRKNFNVAFS